MREACTCASEFDRSRSECVSGRMSVARMRTPVIDREYEQKEQIAMDEAIVLEELLTTVETQQETINELTRLVDAQEKRLQALEAAAGIESEQ